MAETLTGSSAGLLRVALIGNPNSGKTSVFNALTGMRQKVGNYPGVTVERREGQARVAETSISIIDLPGTYSLAHNSPDEQVAVDVIMGRVAGEKPPEVLINVCDASNLARNLYLTTQLVELGRPILLVLTMVDLARSAGRIPDLDALGAVLGIRCHRLEDYRSESIAALGRAIVDCAAEARIPERLVSFPAKLELELEGLLSRSEPRLPFGFGLIELASCSEDGCRLDGSAQAVARLDREHVSWWKWEAEARYAFIDRLMPGLLPDSAVQPTRTATDRVDALLLHRFGGPLVFIALMGLVFQLIFTWASVPTELLEAGFSAFSAGVGALLPQGALHDLVVDGILAGVLNVLVFLPQILVLFLAIGILEDTGYMARAAFMMDRIMRRVGLHGRSFVPMMSSFACAVPGIMSTRSIESRAARLVTILVAPLMSCSARLPVYTLVIGAFFGGKEVWGGVSAGALVMLAMYLLGPFVATCMAYLFRQTLVRGETPTLIMELPPYRMPRWGTVARNVYDRGMLFLRKVWTIILGLTILLWFLQNFPADPVAARPQREAAENLEARLATTPEAEPGREELEAELAQAQRIASSARLRNSFAGRLGRAIEPAIEPLGFDWQIGVGLVASFAAREVLVSTMAQILAAGDDEEDVVVLQERFRDARDPVTGKKLYRPLTGLSLLVFFVLACQCMSTLAVVRRETNSWRWPLFMLAYMTVLAWLSSFAVWQIGGALGY